MQFISIMYNSYNILKANILIRTKKKNYIIKAHYTSKEELESKYNNAEKTRMYITKSKVTGIKKMRIVFYRAKDNEFIKSSLNIYTFKEKTNEELLELGCSF